MPASRRHPPRQEADRHRHSVPHERPKCVLPARRRTVERPAELAGPRDPAPEELLLDDSQRLVARPPGLRVDALGPQEQENLMLVLRKAGEWLDAERKELQRPPKQLSELRKTTRETARKLRDLDYFETFLRSLARDVLRAMANFNFEKSRAHVSGPPLATLMTTKP